MTKDLHIINYGRTYISSDSLKIQSSFFKSYNKIFINYKPQNALEIGPGEGNFAKVFLMDYLGIKKENLYLIDTSETIIDFLKSRDCFVSNNIYCNTAENIIKNLGIKFDVIVLRHVLEHMDKESIMRILPVLYNALSERGKLIIEVPNGFNLFYGFVYLSWDFSHLTPLSQMSLYQAIRWSIGDDVIICFYPYTQRINTARGWKHIFKEIPRFVGAKLIEWISKIVFIPWGFRITSSAIIAVVEKRATLYEK